MGILSYTMYLTSYPEFTGACSVCAAGEMLGVAEPFLEQQMHPTVIIAAFRQALDDIVTAAKEKLRCANRGMHTAWHG